MPPLSSIMRRPEIECRLSTRRSRTALVGRIETNDDRPRATRTGPSGFSIADRAMPRSDLPVLQHNRQSRRVPRIHLRLTLAVSLGMDD